MVDQRNRQVDAFYAGEDVAEARRFLQQYGVRYVILGQTERLYYPQEGLLKFANGLDGALDPVFQTTGLTIFEVRAGALAEASP